MIWLEKGVDNIIAVTASEKATEETYYFLFRFFSQELNKNFLVQLDRENPTSNTYDKFMLDPDTLEMPSGKYHCYVYESTEDGSEDWESFVELHNEKAIVPDDKEVGKIDFEDNGEQDRAFEFS